ncbi:hypothetical protein ACVWZD_005507 [Streptomyces sp. TE3672]
MESDHSRAVTQLRAEDYLLRKASTISWPSMSRLRKLGGNGVRIRRGPMRLIEGRLGPPNRQRLVLRD